MPYEKTKHHHRSTRLLGKVVDGGMRQSQFGQVVSHYWKRIPDHVAHVALDEWVIMPNHVHGIIVIAGRGEASPAPNATHLTGFWRESCRRNTLRLVYTRRNRMF